jgi:Opioid growth factor receptor (OGFr) conserved region
VTKLLIDFYGGLARDAKGRFLRDILAWDDARLESVHDYIQWLFPLPESSAFNWDAPLLDTDTIEAFRAHASLRENLLAAFLRMLAFYGLELGDTVQRAPNFEGRARVWLHPGNHNHLRITRILKSLRLLGLEAEAALFLQALEALYRERPDCISAETYRYWLAAKTA